MRVQDLFNLTGKVAIVVGGAHHLGYDMAEAMAEAGASIVITSRTLQAAKASAAKLAQDTGRATLGLQLDHRSHAKVKAAMAKAMAWKGSLDILINNAGGGVGGTTAILFERDPKDVEDMIANNLIGTLHCCQEWAKLMAPKRKGKLINIASTAGLIGRDRRMYVRNKMLGQPIDYAAAKAGVIGMTKDLAGLLTPMGICVNAISPGGFQRPTHKAGFVKDYSDRTAMGRMGRDGIDLKGAALFLASAASDYVTGHNLVVDGGFTIWQ
jgi:NAD(P)-dependent dehydrogenase (short-subunit alcohol dehydrogenase family)